MPLRSSEIAQCQRCELISRLADLKDVTIRNGIVAAIKVGEEDPRYDDGHESPYIGRCPECGECLYMRNIG